MTGVTEPAAVPSADALRALPKVELHCHLEGAIRPGTVMELAGKNEVALPDGAIRDQYRYGSLDEFLTVFWLVQSVLKDRDDWARLGYESVLDGAAAGRVYAEVFVSPARHLAAGQTLASVLEGLGAGLAAGDAEAGSQTRLIVNMDRGYGGEAGLQLVTELIGLRRAGTPGTDRVIGIGMDGAEASWSPSTPTTRPSSTPTWPASTPAARRRGTGTSTRWSSWPWTASRPPGWTTTASGRCPAASVPPPPPCGCSRRTPAGSRKPRAVRAVPTARPPMTEAVSRGRG
jgi:hypothetical protein